MKEELKLSMVQAAYDASIRPLAFKKARFDAKGQLTLILSSSSRQAAAWVESRLSNIVREAVERATGHQLAGIELKSPD